VGTSLLVWLLAPISAVWAAEAEPPVAFPETDLLPPPEALYVTSGELRSIPLQWQPVLTGNVAGYAVERAPTEDGTFAPIALLDGRFQTDYVDRGDAGGLLTRGDKDAKFGDGSSFWYRVCPYDAERRISQHCSPVQSGKTAAPPDPPPGVQAYSRLPRQVFLRWRPSPNPTTARYAIERSPSQSGDFDRIATVDGRFETTYLDENLGDLRVFYYRIVSINRFGGEGPPSEVVRSVTKPEPLPPIGIALVKAQLGTNDLRWAPNVEPDIAGYKLFRQFDGAKAPELIAKLPADVTEASDTNVPADIGITYTLVAFDNDQLESEPSQPLHLTSEGYGLTAKVDGNAVSLRWKPRADEGFTGARILRTSRLSLRGKSEVVHVLEPVDHVRDETTKSGKRYVYQVVLERADGETAPPSTPVEVSIP